MEENKKLNRKAKASLILFVIGVFMAALDNGIIAAALTTINRSFEVTPSLGAWGITLYTLGLAVSTPIAGKLADRYGRKKLFLIGTAIFGLSSLAIALSTSFPMFLVARLCQALGGGSIFIIASAHVLSTMPKESQGKAIGMLGAMNGMASVLGPNIGSFLMDITGNWHWLFLVNVPIAVVLVIAGYFYIQESKGQVLSRTDYWGIVLLSLAIISIMFAITNFGGTDLLGSFLSWDVLGLMVLGLALFVGLVFVQIYNEKRSIDSILPYALLRQKAYQWTLVLGLFSGTLIAAVIFIPSFAEQVLGISAENSGYWMTPLAIASGIGAGGGGFFVDKKGPVKTLLVSGLIATVGFGYLGLFTTTKWEFVVFSVVAGIGFGFLLGAPLSVLASNAAGEQKGSALGALSVARQIGLTIAPTIYATFIQNGYGKLGTLIPEQLEKAGIALENAPVDMLERFQDPANASQDLFSSIEQIPVPDVQNALLAALNDAAQLAYGNLFLAAALLSFLIIPATLLLKRSLRKSMNQPYNELGNDL